MGNKKLVSMQRGVEILGKLLFNKLQPTEKGDKYAVLFSRDCKDLVAEALERARKEAEECIE